MREGGARDEDEDEDQDQDGAAGGQGWEKGTLRKKRVKNVKHLSLSFFSLKFFRAEMFR